MNRTGVILAGGDLDLSFAKEIIGDLSARGGVYLAAADAGLEACEKLGVLPDLLLGDFDTVRQEVLARFLSRSGVTVERHNPVKDASDLELAVQALRKRNLRDAVVLGALGGRADHACANVRLTYHAALHGMRLTLLDPQNRIRCVLSEGEDPQEVRIQKSEQWGRYIGFFPIGGAVRHLTLTGFRYPLTDFTLTDRTSPSLTVSNELSGEAGTIRFSGEDGAGLLILESRDL